MRRRDIVLAFSLLAGCHGDSSSKYDATAAVVTREPVPADAMVADAPPVDATRPCAADASTHAFRFGTLAAPAGWCWRRTEEGDDQSGILVDGTGRTRMHYFELSFDEKLGDACDAHRAGVRAIADQQVHGVAFRACEVGSDRHCFSFRGLANLCTEAPEDPAFSPIEMIRALVPKKRR